MAYALRYYKELTHADGTVIRLEIHKKDSTTAAVEIGAVVQRLSLEIQGQQDDIDSPIQKTSLHMTFVDASDIEDGRKNGFWQEFYTPDALMWKVILKAKDAKETSFRTIWGGYVTPDSFSEDLVYRGSVSITARDNIGHMQDFPFDAEGDADGMISLYNLVESGWEKIQSPMMLEWRGAAESTMWLMCDGVSAMFTLMNVSMFEGMDWYKAIETALASYGVVMRYVGNNIVKMSSLRSMPYQGAENIEDLIRIEPRFITGAQRELVPAVKRIEESVDYDLETAVSMPQVKVEDFTGSTGTYRCKIDGVEIDGQSFGTAEHDAPVWPINKANGWSNVPSSTLFFNPHAYELGYFAQQRGLGEEMLRYMYIAANNVDNRVVSFSRNITCADMTIRIKFGQPCSLDIQNRFEQQSVFNLKSITFCISLTQNGLTYYYSKGGGWSASYQQITTEYDATTPNYDFEQFIGMGENTGLAELNFSILKIEYAQTSFTGNLSKYGLYACVQDLSFCIAESTSMLAKNAVNTNYQQGNNVILSRDPELAPAMNTTALPAFIKNGIFYRSGNAILPARKWSWGSGSEQQMAVWNHLQLLSYYAKPNNLISGTIVNADITRAQAIYMWHGAEHILVSGTYNFLNGHIESAMLREFARYEDMWREVAGADLPDTEQDSRSNVEGGASGSGASSTYSSTTNVNIGTGGGGGTGASNLNDLNDVDTSGVVAQSVLYYNGTAWVDMSLASLLSGYAKKGTTLADYGITNAYTKTEIDAKGFVVGSSLGTLAYKNGLTASDVGALSVNGGTISGTTNGPLNINTSNASEIGLSLSINSSKKAWFGYNTALGTTQGAAYMYNAVAKKYMGILDDGSAFLGGSTLIHSGNYSSYALPLSGGTITSGATNPLTLNSTSGTQSGLIMRVNGAAKGWFGWDNGCVSIYSYASLKYLGILDNGTPYYGDSGNKYTLIHSGNYSDYALPLSGGKVVGGSALESFGIKTTHSSGLPAFGFYNGDTRIGVLRYMGDRNLYIYDGDFNQPLTIIHSGNIGSQSVDKANSLVYYSVSNVNDAASARLFYGSSATNMPATSYVAGLTIPHGDLGYKYQLAFDFNGNLYSRKYGGTWLDWKTIAFTDSTVDKAKQLVNDSGYPIVNLGASTFYIGSNINSTHHVDILGKVITLRYGANASNGLILNSSGNVTIGNADSAGTNYRLWVQGTTYHTTELYLANWAYLASYKTDGSRVLMLGINNKDLMLINQDGSGVRTAILGGNVGIGTTSPNARLSVFASASSSVPALGALATANTIEFGHAGQYGTYFGTLGNGNGFIQQGRTDGTATAYNMLLQPQGGNVGIGTTDPAYKLDVNGSVHTTSEFFMNHGKAIRMTTNSGKQLNALFASSEHLHLGYDATYVVVGGRISANGGADIYGTLTAGNTTINGNLVVTGDISA